MTRLAPPHHGTVLATGFLVDHVLVGQSEARRRVLERWVPGATLRQLDARRWVLLLPTPQEVHCHAAPGLPLLPDDVAPGRLRLRDQGREQLVDLAELPAVDPSHWLATDHLRLTSLRPYEAPAPEMTGVEHLAPAPAVDLRQKAAVRARSARSDAAIREMSEAGRRGRRGRGEGGGSAPGRPPRDRLARLLMRSPVAGQISRRHARYLDELTRSFERRDYESALRDAVALGAASAAYLSLRLPSPRSRTSGATPNPAGGGGAIPLGMSAQQHLTQLYRQAAAELERQGRVAEAAFVLADLLHRDGEAVGLLERHGQLAAAAELAEGRELDPAEVVRLWWRAGQRDRAIGIARGRGAHAAAIERLEKVDHEAAVALRDHWAQSLARAGDFLGAVEVTWKAEELRHRTREHVATGMALGGVTAARLFAYQLALGTTGEALDTAKRLLAAEDPEQLTARDGFLSVFATLPAADPVADRQLATLALRLLVGARSPRHWTSAERRTAHNALRERADPVLREDLPSGFTPGADGPRPRHELVLAGPPAQVGISDAVAMAGATTLVACRAHGLRLLGRSGAARGHWDVPAHRLVAAHHGGSAVVATDLGQGSWELHLFDLVRQRLDRWIVIRAVRLVPEFDGTVFTFVDETGTLVFLDVEAARARVVWTDVDEGVALDVCSTTSSMAALVRLDHPAQPTRFEAWRWDLPQRALRQRQVLEVDGAFAGNVLPDGRFVALIAEEERTVLRVGSSERDAGGAEALSASGGAYAVLRPGVMDLVAPRFDLQISSEDGAIGFRYHQERLAVWDDAGHLAILDGMTGETLFHGRIEV